MHVRLWHSPYNGGWIYFDRKQLRRFSAGWTGKHHNSRITAHTLWWALFGFCGSIMLQTWPWRRPASSAGEKP